MLFVRSNVGFNGRRSRSSRGPLGFEDVYDDKHRGHISFVRHPVGHVLPRGVHGVAGATFYVSAFSILGELALRQVRGVRPVVVTMQAHYSTRLKYQLPDP